jgi:hypothetical protein
MKPTAAQPVFFESLEARQLLSTAHVHHEHHLHTLHHLAHLHRLHLHVLHRQHLHRAHLHHRHHRHALHTAHVLRTTIPKPIFLTAQQRNDWPEIRDSVLANRPRVHP